MAARRDGLARGRPTKNTLTWRTGVDAIRGAIASCVGFRQRRVELSATFPRKSWRRSSTPAIPTPHRLYLAEGVGHAIFGFVVLHGWRLLFGGKLPRSVLVKRPHSLHADLPDDRGKACVRRLTAGTRQYPWPRCLNHLPQFIGSFVSASSGHRRVDGSASVLCLRGRLASSVASRSRSSGLPCTPCRTPIAIGIHW